MKRISLILLLIVLLASSSNMTAGELRMPGQMQARLREAAKLGFKTAIVPKAIRAGEGWPKGIEIIEARSVQQALDAALVSHELPKGRKVA